MRWLTGPLRRFTASARFERDMREELRLHIEHRADDLAAGGVRRDRALRQARLEFGAIEDYKDQCRDAGGVAPLRLLQGFGSDLRMAARRLLATPAFTIFAVLSLALGIGVTTAVYSVVDRIFWSALGIQDPGAVVLVMDTQSGSYSPGRVSAPDFEDLRAAQTSCSAIAASRRISPGVTTAAATEVQPGEAVDDAYFPTLGVRAAIGRVIQPGDVASAASVVVLSHALWRSRFASNPNVVGQTVRLSGRPFEIVGVAPESFEGATPGPGGGPRASRIWVPLGAAEWFAVGSAASPTPARERRQLIVIGRLQSGRTVQQAASELAALSASLDAAYPRPASAQPGASTRRGWSARTVAGLNEQGDTMRRFGLLVFGLITLVLVVACTNLANLVLARGTMRQQEFAVRRALGASRWRLVREQSAESAILAAAGGGASWLVIKALTRMLDVEIPIAQSWMVSVRPETNGAALAVAAAAMLLSLVVFGLEPALQLTKQADVRADLAAGAGSVGVPKARRQRTLLRWQVAISTGFFIIASLCVRYMVAEARHDSGIELDRIGVALVDFYGQRWDEPRARRTLQRVLDEARHEPGIDAVAVSSGLPFGTTITPHLLISTVDKPITSRRDQADAMVIAASPDYFRAAGTAILRGRAFDDRDEAGAPSVVVLSESTARKMFGSADAVGRQMLVKVDTQFRGVGSEQPVKTATVVGIAGDTDLTHFLMRNGATVYVPFAQEYSPWTTIVARAYDPAAAVRALRAAARKADPDLAIAQAASGRAMLAGPYLLLRGASSVAVSLGALTLLLAMVGLYGVQSHIVAHRTREIGVRMSCGATAAQIKRMILEDGYRPVLQGLAIGVFIGLAGRAIVRSLVLATMDVIDPWMLAVVPIPLLLAAFCACYLPAHRASRVDPNVALRHL